MPVCLSVYLSISVSVYLFILSISVCLCLSVCLSIYLSVGLSLHSIYFCLSVPACLSVCLFVCLSVCLSVYLSISVSVYLFSYFFHHIPPKNIIVQMCLKRTLLCCAVMTPLCDSSTDHGRRRRCQRGREPAGRHSRLQLHPQHAPVEPHQGEEGRSL